jgi:hypothetical protein
MAGWQPDRKHLINKYLNDFYWLDFVLRHGRCVTADTAAGDYFFAVNELIRMPNGARPKTIRIPRLETAQAQVGKARAA